MELEDTIDEGIVVENLNDYLQKISNIRKSIREEEGENADSQKFFFRGQANYDWDVIPGVFREHFLPIEAELIRSAYLRNPSEFRKVDTDFEKLAKLQHYGLPTRLLDVTSNPLVALYFACQAPIETDGAVYVKRAYSKGCNDLEVSVLSHLTNVRIDGDTTLNRLLDELEEKRIYTIKTAKNCRDQEYKSLIDILQNNYFVESNMNNERLIRQSGLFLLVGKYNVLLNEVDSGQSIIQTAISSAKDDFAKEIFRIPSIRKEMILQELDFCNVNEGALFPELEHQMTYIKRVKVNNGGEVESFTKIDINNGLNAVSQIQKEYDEDELLEIIDKVLKSSVNKVLFDECKVAILENMAVDWYRRDSILSKIRIALTSALSNYGMDRAEAKRIATIIVDNILNELKVKEGHV